MNKQIRVTIWNENLHEREAADVMAVYPHGIHKAIAAGLAGNISDIKTVRNF